MKRQQQRWQTPYSLTLENSISLHHTVRIVGTSDTPQYNPLYPLHVADKCSCGLLFIRCVGVKPRNESLSQFSSSKGGIKADESVMNILFYFKLVINRGAMNGPLWTIYREVQKYCEINLLENVVWYCACPIRLHMFWLAAKYVYKAMLIKPIYEENIFIEKGIYYMRMII